MSNTISAKLTLWANRVIALILLVLIFLMPRLLAWYGAQRPLGASSSRAIAVAFYCCCVPVATALWELERLLRAILAGQVFVRDNVRRIRLVRWCCLAVGLICLPAAFFYPPLIFMVVIMTFLTLVVSVLSSVMGAAVEIREENDLTI